MHISPSLNPRCISTNLITQNPVPYLYLHTMVPSHRGSQAGSCNKYQTPREKQLTQL